MNRTYLPRVCRVEVPGKSISENASRTIPTPSSSTVSRSRKSSTTLSTRRCSCSEKASQARDEDKPTPQAVGNLPFKNSMLTYFGDQRNPSLDVNGGPPAASPLLNRRCRGSQSRRSCSLGARGGYSERRPDRRLLRDKLWP